MNIEWQTLAALGIALAAAVYVFRRLRRTWSGRRPPGCNVCTQCPTDEGQPQLVSLDPPPKN